MIGLLEILAFIVFAATITLTTIVLVAGISVWLALAITDVFGTIIRKIIG